MAILDISNVSKSFGGVKANVDISMSVEQGSIVGLIGPNGSGKTTLFNSIVGTYTIDSGSIKFNDKEVSIRFPIKKRVSKNSPFFLNTKKPNIVCIILESFSKEFVGYLNNGKGKFTKTKHVSLYRPRSPRIPCSNECKGCC